MIIEVVFGTPAYIALKLGASLARIGALVDLAAVGPVV